MKNECLGCLCIFCFKKEACQNGCWFCELEDTTELVKECGDFEQIDKIIIPE